MAYGIRSTRDESSSLESDQPSFDNLAAISQQFDHMVPTINSDNSSDIIMTPFVYMDHAATSPLLLPVKQFADQLELSYRSNVGRSYGYSERVLRQCMAHTRIAAMRYFGADERCLTVFGSNVSQLLMLFYKHVLAAEHKSYFVLSPISHSALSMPLRAIGRDRWEYMSFNQCSDYDVEVLNTRLQQLQYQGEKNITLAVETISNLTGYETNWREVITAAERFGCRVIIDNAQGATFEEIDLKSYNADVYVAVSGHKMGARDGSGILVGPQNIFNLTRPLEPTSGMIFHYTEDQEFFMPPPSTLEYGTPNYIAQSSLGEAFRVFSSVGLANVKNKVRSITKYLLDQLNEIDGVKVLGCDKHDHDRYGPVSFVGYDSNGREIPSMAIAAALSYFHGVQLRANHHCSPVYLQRLKGISNDTANMIANAAQRQIQGKISDTELGIARNLAGTTDLLSALHAVRPSVGFATKAESVDKFIVALKSIFEKKQYTSLDVVTVGVFGFNEFVPKGISKEVYKRLIFPSIPRNQQQ